MNLISTYVEYEEVLDFTYQFSKVFLAKYYESKRRSMLIKHKNITIGSSP